MITQIHEQFTRERNNEQFYRALAAAADVVNWPGATKYFENAADEEREHAKRIQDYIIARNEKPYFDLLKEIPTIDGNNYKGMFDLALEKERETTKAINDMVEIAYTSPDVQTVALLVSSQGDWPGYVQEQTNSERELTDLILEISRLGPDGIEVFDKSLL